ncbi:hypothetical protein [Megasphaera sp. NM10]|jgi:hypothetical protein|uniref:hypothetical protein n=1 Tax=Megasphaera sp. NM10 TaxID=1273103 RepID=UPI0003572632|nr:hypothetical protein [Megasphaera sp. NM10]EPP18780.1 hypothetical protein NM10_01746 [Megasphaera sp. NM10]
MSKWTDVRDSIVDVLNAKDVTEEVKQTVTQKIIDEVIPIVENAVDNFCAATKEQAKTETGWVKVRDGIVLPLVMEGVVYIVKTVLNKTATETA